MRRKLVSVVVPCLNEESNIKPFFDQLSRVAKKESRYDFEFIYVNDGSTDQTLEELQKLAQRRSGLKVVNLSRNFGKEIATTAGIYYAEGDAIITIDGDGQHPPELIPKLLAKWRNGADVVVGVRKTNQKEGVIKRYGSKLFYAFISRLAEGMIVSGSTDYCLINKKIQAEFNRLTEHHRMTRGLIDWIGFNCEYVEFAARARLYGEAGYSTQKLIGLALNAFVSLSIKPLYFLVYMGLVVLPISALVLLFSIIEMLVGDPLGLHIKGSAYLILAVIFLMGIVLASQGVIAIYLSHVHVETQNRPLFIVDKSRSFGINEGME